MKYPIYLDHNATTPMDPKVFEAMKPYFMDKFGNPASQTHAYGWEAEEVVNQARQSIAQSIGADDPKSILFTGSATESNNLVIQGLTKGTNKRSIHIITQKTEHKCILDSCKEIERKGHTVTYLDVDAEGRVNPHDVEKAIQDNTLLCSIMFANNEIGTLQPVREIATICHKHGIYFHSDAVQAVGHIPVDVKKDGIDLMSLSGHKIYGPKGIGALYISSKIPIHLFSPLLFGGGHERGLRSGTLNVPSIVGLAKALEISVHERTKESKRLSSLRDDLISQIKRGCDGVQLNGHPKFRLPNNINLSFDFIKNDDLIIKVPEIAIASGSACSSGSSEPSYVIKALTRNNARIHSAIRIGLGRTTTKEHIDIAAQCIIRAYHEIRKTSVEYRMKKEK